MKRIIITCPLILHSKWNPESSHIQSEMNGAKTRYCYDEFGLLRCVVMPTAIDPASADNVFKYQYDSKRRLTDKAMPVGDWVYYIYDARDRLVLTQDGNQRIKSTPEWSYTIYDSFNRPIEQGTWATSASRATLVTSINNSLTYMSGQASRVALKYFYYNIYTSVPVANAYDINDGSALGAVRSTTDIGRQTGEKIKLLNSETGMTSWLFTAIYYDKFGRVIQTVSDNHLGGKDYITNKYNFAGEVIQTRHRHTADAGTTYTDTYFDLDHRGRLMKTRLKINGTDEVLMAGNNYNEAGNLAIQYLHSENGGAFLQKNDYTYNIRGWVTQLNNPGSFTENDKFGMMLEYNTVTSPAIAKYNGNIAGFTWGTPNLINARYVYSYDNNNRLTIANYTATSNTYALDENFTYDANGNLTAVNRYNYSGTYIDRLVFTYQGNRVTGLKDVAGDNTTVIDYPGTNISLPYTYDYNGNVTNEPHKQLGIENNMMNLPYIINWNGLNRKINYFYTFNGEKLRKTVENSGTITKVDYCGPFVYETASGVRSLKYFVTPYGRVIKNGSTWEYEYNLTDHLGNVRVVIKKGTNGLASIVQQKGYYAFGMEISQFSPGTNTSKNWYNGKELQDDFGLYWYDYGARFYDPGLGRWHSVDPLAEKYYQSSPYSYTLNNPVNFIDPDGRSVYKINRETGNITLRRENNKNFDKLKSSSFKSIRLEKGIMSSREETKGVRGRLSSGEIIEKDITRFCTNSATEAREFFKFAADNSNVEWSETTVRNTKGENTIKVGTTNESGYELSQSVTINEAFRNNETIIEANHSHPSGNTKVSPGDHNVAVAVQGNNPDAKLNIYPPKGEFKPFNMGSTVGELEEIIVRPHKW